MSRMGTFILALSLLPHGLGAGQARSDELETIVLEPLEGEAAKLDNEQELREGRNAFEAGLLKLQRDIITEGLRRAIAADHTAFGEAVSALRLCTEGCKTDQSRCLASLPPPSDLIRESSCGTDRALCETSCTQDLIVEVASIPRGEKVDGNDQRLEGQREDAQLAIQIHRLRDTQAILQHGLVALQAVPLEEGIRQTLENYSEYGVPPGPTRINDAVNNLEECADRTIHETSDCIEESRQRAVEEEVTICKPDGECVTVDQVGFAGLGVLILRSFNCVAVGAIKTIGCGKATEKRFGAN